MPIMPICRESGKTRNFKQAVSTTVAANTFGYNNAGYATAATSSSLITLNFAYDQTITTPTQDVLCLQVDNETEFLADCNTNTSQANVGVSYDLLDEATVDNSTSGTQVTCVAVVGTAANKQMIIRVNPASLAA